MDDVQLGGGVNWGDGISVNLEAGERLSKVQPFSNLFLKILTEGAVTTEAGSLFQYFTTLTEKADPIPRRWPVPWSTFFGALQDRDEWEGENTSQFYQVSGNWHYIIA